MKLIKHFLTLILVLSSALAGLFVAGHFNLIHFYQPFLVLSGSMEPTILTGSVVLVLPKPLGYSRGDIVTFKTSRRATPTTHRISALTTKDGQLAYQTKGDANSDPDALIITPDQVVGSVSLIVPYIGYAANVAQTPQGFIALVIIPATIVVYEELKTLLYEITKESKRFAAKLGIFKPTTTDSLEFTTPAVIPARSHRGLLNAHFRLRASTFDLSEAIPIEKPAFDFKLAIIPMIASILVTVAVSSAYFYDSETNGNVLGAASNYGEQLANIYISDPYTCEAGATDTTTKTGFYVFKQVGDNLNLQIKLTNALPNTVYDLWVNQNPGACPSDAPTAPAAFQTDSNGQALYNYNDVSLSGANTLWISLVGGGHVLRSQTVSQNN